MSPNRRGTLDILWSCSITFVLCSWSVLCINIPGKDEKDRTILGRKLLLTVLCAIAPEVTFGNSLCQFSSAYDSLKLFPEPEYEGWTLTHGFYADMGGFSLSAPDYERPFPIDSRQLHQLVKHGYVEYPKISRDEIRDKNKADGLVRIIAFVQTIWFTVDICFRKAQHLAITTLELTTVAFIVCSFATTICWFRKPADIRTRTELKTEFKIADIRAAFLQEPEDPFRKRTPLDFWSSPSANYPEERIGDTAWHDASSNPYAYWSFLIQTLWRAATVTCEVVAFSVWVTTEHTYRFWPWFRSRMPSKRTCARGPASDRGLTERTRSNARQWFAAKMESTAASLRNTTELKDPALDVPLKAMVPLHVLGVFYFTARAYIWVSDFVELRSLPESAYHTVNWSWMMPHF